MNSEALDIAIRLAQTGQRKAQEVVYKSFYQYGIGLGMHYLGSPDMAMTAYNDAMFKTLTKIGDYQFTSPFKSWFRQIMVRTVIDYYRKEMKRETIDLDEAATASLHSSIESDLSAEEILALLKDVPPSYRVVFLLHVVDGYTLKEVAEKLEITEGGAKTLYFKARLKMQKLMESKGITNESTVIKK